MSERVLKKRVVYAGDVHTELMKAGWTPKDAARLLECVPDADVAQVVHGVWVQERTVQNPYRGSGTSYHCSVCGRRAGYKQVPLYLYCPNCGAEMDGGETSEAV